ncbi:hypothetical protein D3C87_1681610 [compost metagenome]
MALRSCCNRYLARFQPPFNGPINWLLGTFTLSKNTWQNADLPLIKSIGCGLTPELRMSSTIRLMPSCFGALKSVRTRAYIQSDLSP